MSYAFLHSGGQSRKAARARACCIEFRRLVRGLDCESVHDRNGLCSAMLLKRTFQVHFKCIMSGPSCRFRTWDFASDRSEAKSNVHAVWYARPVHPVHPDIMLKTPPLLRYGGRGTGERDLAGEQETGRGAGGRGTGERDLAGEQVITQGVN